MEQCGVVGSVIKFEKVLSPNDEELLMLHDAAKLVGGEWSPRTIQTRPGVSFYRVSHEDRFLVAAVVMSQEDLFVWLLGGTRNRNAIRDLGDFMANGLHEVAKQNGCIRIRAIVRKGMGLEMLKRGFSVRNFEMVKEVA